MSENVLRAVLRVTLTEVTMLRGAGTPDDVVRVVTLLFNDNGECVAEHDPCYPTPWYAPIETCKEARA